jgi:chaperone required for assembly of F1-ATPase
MNRKRFYKQAAATAENTITLDGKLLKTPEKNLLHLPNKGLAEAVAAEWQNQGQTIDPTTMFLTKLANTAIDRVEPRREVIIAEMVDFAGSDLVCYRADCPPDLVASQKAHWDAILAWASSELGADFQTAIGIVHIAQPPEALYAIRHHLQTIDSFRLTALHNVMTLTGSALIATMAGQGALTPDSAWESAHVDEDHQIAHWGWDDEAKARRTLRQREFMACFQFLSLLRESD